eukprot:scaffold49856_cov36-Phaeocystis_antarctica.AAC.1
MARSRLCTGRSSVLFGWNQFPVTLASRNQTVGNVIKPKQSTPLSGSPHTPRCRCRARCHWRPTGASCRRSTPAPEVFPAPTPRHRAVGCR